MRRPTEVCGDTGNHMDSLTGVDVIERLPAYGFTDTAVRRHPRL